MISVVIPTLNAEKTLPATLTALVPAAVEGLVREVIVVDGGSRDHTRAIADNSGADVVETSAGRGTQLARGAALARSSWLLFLHADTVLEEGWEAEAVRLIRRVERRDLPLSAGTFRFRLNDRGYKPRAIEMLVRARCAALALPYGDQGLLIPRQLFDEIGGYREMPIMEDVDIVRRLGRRRLVHLQARAITSADRFKRDGYLARALRNQVCLALYGCGVPAQRIVRLYGRAKP
jgi:rSAM/selenodomain-associated transferase 2